MSDYKKTPRTTLKRRRQRGHYDKATVHAILDAGIVGHLGLVVDGAPFVVPTLHWRDGERVYVHGSAASRTLRALAKGAEACLTVTHIDGLVLARSAFHHSVNYRSVMLFGRLEKIDDRGEKNRHMMALVEKIAPGRWADVRPPTAKELKATTVLAMAIDEVSAKVRTGPPIDDEDDHGLPAWAGVVPLSLVAGEAVPDPRLAPGTPLPEHLSGRRPSK